MPLPHVAAVLMLALTAGSVAAQGEVDNPVFASWAKFKTGTSVTYKVTIGTEEFVDTVTLIEVGPDRLVLESTSTVKVNKMPITSSEKREVRKTRDVPPGYTKEDIARGRVRGTTEEGTEVIKINGVEYKTRWSKHAYEEDGTKWAGKQWVCDDVPGRAVRSEGTCTRSNTIEVIIELVEIKTP